MQLTRAHFARRASRIVVAPVLVVLAVCAGEPADPVREIDIMGLDASWSLDEIERPVDVELFGGDLYILAGGDEPELWRVGLGDAKPSPVRVRIEDAPEGRPRMLESNAHLLYLAGEWGADILAIRPDGRAIGAPRRLFGDYDFVPWITGELLKVGSDHRPGILIEASVPVGSRERSRLWGALPRTADRVLRRGESPPFSDVFIESDALGQVHAILNSSGAMVRYDHEGEATLVRWLPQDMVEVGLLSTSGRYGEPLEHTVNGLELSCDGYLWVSVGEAEQRVALIDPRDYRVVQRLAFEATDLRDATWTHCGDWVVGLSSKSDRVVVGRVAR